MTSPSWVDRTGATPKKLALIAVLAVVLIGVLGNQLVGTDAEVSSDKPSRPPATTPDAKDISPHAAEQSPVGADHVVATPEWQELPLPLVLAHDPFQPPDWYVVANQSADAQENIRIVDNAEQVLEQLRQKSMNIVVISGTNKVATIGGTEVRIGDLIEGFRVTDITTEGVVLSEMKTR